MRVRCNSQSLIRPFECTCWLYKARVRSTEFTADPVECFNIGIDFRLLVLLRTFPSFTSWCAKQQSVAAALKGKRAPGPSLPPHQPTLTGIRPMQAGSARHPPATALAQRLCQTPSCA